MTRMKAATLAAIALMVAMQVAASASDSGALCARPEQIEVSRDGWASISAPQFSDGADEITSYAVDPSEPSRFYISNGTVIARTTDGGCAFEEVFNGSKQEPLSVTVGDLAVAPNDGTHVVAVVATMGTPVTPGVAVSDDSGATWAVNTKDIKGAEIRKLIFASDGHTLYAAVNPTTAALAYGLNTLTGVVFRSQDGGATWELMTTPAGAADVRGPILDLEIDPRDHNVLWTVFGGGALFVSRDAGATFEHIPGNPDLLKEVAVNRDAAGAKILAFSNVPNGSTPIFASVDGGKTWSTTAVPDAPQPVSSAIGTPRGIVMTAEDRVGLAYLLSGDRWLPLVNSFHPRMSDLEATPTGDIFANSGAAVMHLPPPGSSALGGPLLTDRGSPLGRFWNAIERPPLCEYKSNQAFEMPSPPKEILADDVSTLSPDGLTLSMGAGESRDVDYSLKLLRSHKVDLFFLIDTSQSMDGPICATIQVLADLARRLSRSGFDTHFGLAEYNDVGHRNGRDGCTTPYRLRLPISPPGPSLLDAFNKLWTCGGDEPAPLGLQEAAIGDGQDLLPPGSSGNDIPPGRDAGWRPDATKIVLHVTDEIFQKYPDTPTTAEAILALRSRHIYQMGLVAKEGQLQKFQPDPNSDPVVPGASRPDLETVAIATGAIASKAVDCNGNGNTDIPRGGPLVCGLNNYDPEIAKSLGPAITDMVASLIGLDDVNIVASSGEEVVDDIQPAAFTGLDPAHDHLLDFDVTYNCAGHAGRVIDVTLQAVSASDGLLDTATTTVGCAPRVIPPTPPARGGAAPIVVPELPAPVTPYQFNPGVQASAQVQPQPQQQAQQQAQQQSQQQAQAQGAVVTQRQQQVQVAFVHAANNLQDQHAAEYAMSRLRYGRGDPLEAAKFGLAVGSISMMLMFGFATAAVRRAFNRY